MKRLMKWKNIFRFISSSITIKKSHQGRNMDGRTPYQVFLDGIRKSVKKEDQ
ncbi:hypothetical protein LEP1GSC199_0015 [Leptospira vanthielii serovar Holland str. Waz Holland = ATCC 700522]|uniref:Uncharacterized protein n=2 Tax=Leptospira vanthielii TaxID=293085 RepID=N1W7B9_9LEPT|nr:hypothetical protein LEP1GSC199_0015 [Leptospira vanthielii serovar Holland str. Waz Holland = ATCC 700522]